MRIQKEGGGRTSERRIGGTGKSKCSLIQLGASLLVLRSSLMAHGRGRRSNPAIMLLGQGYGR